MILKRRLTYAIFVLFITVLLISVPHVYAESESTEQTSTEAQIAEIVYEGNQELNAEEFDDTSEDDSINFQLVILSPEDQRVDLNNVIDTVNQDLSRENVPAHLRMVEDPQNDAVSGYMLKKDGTALPLETGNRSQTASEPIDPARVCEVIDNHIKETIGAQTGNEVEAASLVSYINVSLSTSYDSDKNRVKVTASRNISTMPSPATLTLELQNRLTGAYFETKQEKAINFRTAKSGSVKYGTTRTRIWRATLTGKLGKAKVDYKTYSYIYNKKCKRYPSYTEVYSKKELYKPPTNLAVDKVKRKDSFRNDYIAAFEKKYPRAKVNWNNYEIHHMRPLKYGGSNAVSNGIALTTERHKKLTSWWGSY